MIVGRNRGWRSSDGGVCNRPRKWNGGREGKGGMHGRMTDLRTGVLDGKQRGEGGKIFSSPRLAKRCLCRLIFQRRERRFLSDAADHGDDGPRSGGWVPGAGNGRHRQAGHEAGPGTKVVLLELNLLNPVRPSYYRSKTSNSHIKNIYILAFSSYLNMYEILTSGFESCRLNHLFFLHVLLIALYIPGNHRQWVSSNVLVRVPGRCIKCARGHHRHVWRALLAIWWDASVSDAAHGPEPSLFLFSSRKKKIEIGMVLNIPLLEREYGSPLIGSSETGPCLSQDIDAHSMDNPSGQKQWAAQLFKVVQVPMPDIQSPFKWFLTTLHLLKDSYPTRLLALHDSDHTHNLQLSCML
ncbi:hypothetical protein VP01_717g2 [Puccinia sorghi]|uniref:Uncharacterized protein n=1 Tax=Puccinia sorghi TaxID=27349 RepID=A0A0L6UDA6_9BASI|nr:hypothetical protein VP01_717g2 [Puccinia sorghi]